MQKPAKPTECIDRKEYFLKQSRHGREGTTPWVAVFSSPEQHKQK
jgi:hypothetical protein